MESRTGNYIYRHAWYYPMSTTSSESVVISGLGPICPLGIDLDSLWTSLESGTSGVRRVASLPADEMKSPFGGEAWDFTGDIEQFGELERGTQRLIRKGMRMMCREIQMGVAASQKALEHAKLDLETVDPERIGVVYGCDYIQTTPDEYGDAVRQCLDEDGSFDFGRWAEHGIPQMNPLWLLKYLPNMPASHIAIYNDLRGPNNSLTMREPAGNQAITEAYFAIERGHADCMLAGSTGTRIHPLKSVQASMQEACAGPGMDPDKVSRPFDLERQGMVMGEGAGAILLERRENAVARGATIYGEIIGYGASTVIDADGTPRIDRALENVARQALETAEITPSDVGHIHAHGLSCPMTDAQEAAAIQAVFGDRDSPVPVVAAKSYFGNLGAGSGTVELISSLLAFQNDHLFPVLNYETPDPACPLNLVLDTNTSPGDSVLNLSVSPQAQASSLLIRRC